MSAVYASGESLTQLHAFHENYYDYGDLHDESRTKRDFTRALEILENRLPPTERKLLDIGYGNGFFLAVARTRGWDVDGIDTSPQNRKLAKKKFALDLRVGTVNDLAAASCQYNVIALWDVMEHLPDPHDMINNLSRMLEPGGILLIAVPNDHSFLRDLSCWLFAVSGGRIRTGVEKCYLLEHVGYYATDSLQKLVCPHGFTLGDHFFSSTDLAKYNFTLKEKIMAGFVLLLGRLFHRQNRLIAFFRHNTPGRRKP
ncbi:MAG: class I SAM-dependent methyltransferase [Candidatus Omnitrophota bacterium]|jgi:2-polyprenyl-3-methyl-5-hydroxy-6-metoxy-1,4-benzoquinol methylase